ncbi:MarR family transcriptional regulator [Agrobacterium tumefaciens]|uniref:bifunctional helix-turn-helix transcriptional regulator/GNAT family N-acetyltransferase n=1 Tax=Agrobacterium tumefaciens TaxID=358 RepID=UPI00157379AF|nr:bifunctional helix-turn-helix transcriptional regulator/GNAT family N-acetyltransferase [Agrobacterium tumefaciens]NTE56189.1 MarR family transcriptional regulator [Agrobacterium tumefaciens]NTE74100.1 MarR family transcriptional regulator [Agrobacterium tumefaciens]
MSEQSLPIDDIRFTSRRLVRELGFMGGDFAGTDLPPSAVHALIEIETCPGITARDLGKLLRLEKSSVSRMLRKLVLSGDILEKTDGQDNRIKLLFLADRGQRRAEAIHAFANRQVSGALTQLTPADANTILAGLRLYADALGDRSDAAAPAIDIVSGYRPGIIARITQMHALYYARASGFGQRFESVVAEGLASFCNRLERPQNAIWTAMRGDKIVGSVAIDGEDLGSEIAHLRWFIVDDSVRGGGVGRRLLAAALAFADKNAFAETHLWTFNGLSAARHLYETHGFTCVEEHPGSQWGSEVLEQRFIRRLKR